MMANIRGVAADGRGAAADGRGAAADGRGAAADGRGAAADGRGAAAGGLHMITGPMFSGKTTELGRIVRVYEKGHRRVLIARPITDTRNASDGLYCHSGDVIAAKVVAFATIGELSAMVAETTPAAVFVDEAQFAAGSPDAFIAATRAWRRAGIDVYCAGLTLDYNGRAFGITAALLCEATHTTRLRAICVSCGAPADFSKLVTVAPSGTIIAIDDGVNKYEPRCLKCMF